MQYSVLSSVSVRGTAQHCVKSGDAEKFNLDFKILLIWLPMFRLQTETTRTRVKLGKNWQFRMVVQFGCAVQMRALIKLIITRLRRSLLRLAEIAKSTIWKLTIYLEGKELTTVAESQSCHTHLTGNAFTRKSVVALKWLSKRIQWFQTMQH